MIAVLGVAVMVTVAMAVIAGHKKKTLVANLKTFVCRLGGLV
jgi:hypothetical protein